MSDNEMKAEYDFSGADQGKFHDPDAQFQIPVYLESDIMAFVEQIAERKGTDVSAVVNDLIKGDRDLLSQVL